MAARAPRRSEGNKALLCVLLLFYRLAAPFWSKCSPIPQQGPRSTGRPPVASDQPPPLPGTQPLPCLAASPSSPFHRAKLKTGWDRAEEHMPRATQPLWDSFYWARWCEQCLPIVLLGQSREMMDVKEASNLDTMQSSARAGRSCGDSRMGG